jgi:hypothetical protein
MAFGNGCQPQGAFYNRGMQAKHANLGTVSQSLEWLKYQHSKIRLTGVELQ